MSAGHAMIIARKDIQEALRSRTTYLYLGLLVLISIPFIQGLRAAVNQAGEVDSSALAEASQAYVSGLFYTLPLFAMMLFSSFLSTYTVITEKAKRTLESLLATPASLRDVWFGKSLAVAIPSALITIVLLVGATIALNAAFIVPEVGHFVMPGLTAVLTGFLTVPVMSFFVVAIVTFLQLIIANPRLANFAFMGIFLAVYVGGITQLAGRLDFSVIFLGITVVLGLVTVLLSPLLTKQRVVLSSKG